MGAKSKDPVERVRSIRAGAESEIAESFRRARGAVADVARDIKQLRGRTGSLVKKPTPRQ